MDMGVFGLLAGPGSRTRCAIFAAMMAPFLLSACNTGSPGQNLESTLRPTPNQNVGNAGNMAPPQAVQPQAAQPGQNQQVASVTGLQPIAFLPVSNIPQGAVTTLSGAIRNSAQRQGVPIVASVQQGAQYQVKGYFSALDDSGGTLLVYVWDVNDRNNKRVYRINGQEQTSAKSSDPWAAVNAEMLNRVADNTMRQLKGWLATRN
ncbi:MAG: hypothetical protein KDJ63_04535 [Nitratireductor sp.]|nr:hypothetical protein [Nitratireductor sp.]